LAVRRHRAVVLVLPATAVAVAGRERPRTPRWPLCSPAAGP